MLKRTKIIATLGPSTDKPGVLHQILRAGVDVVRINLSHSTHALHEERILKTRLHAEELGKTVAVMVDLQGPKIRIACFESGFITLKAGDSFIIDAHLPKDKGTEHSVGVDYARLPQEVYANDTLLLDDGLIVLTVDKVVDAKIHCTVKLGGRLSNHKGINRLGGGLTAEPLTEKDKNDILFAVKMNADYVALSFPRCAADINLARHHLEKAGSNARLLAKIERVEALDDLENIIDSADGIMVARGDLGVEMGYAELPAIQKKMIAKARLQNKPVVTATQMMESMIHQPIPTRAEVSDIANAVLDGTDAVMLSAETATGEFPLKVVQAMVEICLAAEREPIKPLFDEILETRRTTRTDETIATVAMVAASRMDIKAIVALTETGLTPLWMSRFGTHIPIYGISRHLKTNAYMTLYRGVYPVYLNLKEVPNEQLIEGVIAELLRLNMLQKNDKIVITRGKTIGDEKGANILEIVTVRGEEKWH